MKLVASKRASTEKLDRLSFVRNDGTQCEIEMPRQGVLPHDLVHYVVESLFGLQGGFLSLIARGADARFVMDAIDAINDMDTPSDPKIQNIELAAVQAEAMVEAMQTQLWGGSFDYASFVYGAQMAAQARNIEAPVAPIPALAQKAYDAAIALNLRWAAVKPYTNLELAFETSGESQS
jgi:hypothetical protein